MAVNYLDERSNEERNRVKTKRDLSLLDRNTDRSEQIQIISLVEYESKQLMRRNMHDHCCVVQDSASDLDDLNVHSMPRLHTQL